LEHRQKPDMEQGQARHGWTVSPPVQAEEYELTDRSKESSKQGQQNKVRDVMALGPASIASALGEDEIQQ